METSICKYSEEKWTCTSQNLEHCFTSLAAKDYMQAYLFTHYNFSTCMHIMLNYDQRMRILVTNLMFPYQNYNVCNEHMVI